METTSAPSRTAASSKEVRVRVLGSTKRFTTVRPSSEADFFTGRASKSLKVAARIENQLDLGPVQFPDGEEILARPGGAH
jgi:hypothetical protein